jgi:hypothetical protein
MKKFLTALLLTLSLNSLQAQDLNSNDLNSLKEFVESFYWLDYSASREIQFSYYPKRDEYILLKGRCDAYQNVLNQIERIQKKNQE